MKTPWLWTTGESVGTGPPRTKKGGALQGGSTRNEGVATGCSHGTAERMRLCCVPSLTCPAA